MLSVLKVSLFKKVSYCLEQGYFLYTSIAKLSLCILYIIYPQGIMTYFTFERERGTPK
jgi:hypothetical protein